MVTLHELYPHDLRHTEVFSSHDQTRIAAAVVFARERHGDQRRVKGPLFVTHPIAAAQILIDEFHADADTVIAGLLHDTAEDTATTLEEIEAHFGQTVRFLVDGATDVGKGDGAPKIEDKEERALQSHKKVLVYIMKDPRVLLVKCADRWHNLLTCDALRPKNQERMARESLDFHIPHLRTAGHVRQADEMAQTAHDVLARAHQASHHA